MCHHQTRQNLQQWYNFIGHHKGERLGDILADNVVFCSPVVHTPQEGKTVTMMYLSAATNLLTNEHFRYVGEFLSENGAVLEFETEIDGVLVNGIDMITWNNDGFISQFKVMIRPLQAIKKIHEAMKVMLDSTVT